MELLTISRISREYGISTRTLRYYEQIGLISSQRRVDYAYRVYDETALKRLQQVVILRKLQIPVKQIRVILSNPDAAAAIEIFKQNIAQLDNEIAALSTIKSALVIFVAKIEELAHLHLSLDLLTDDAVVKLAESLSLIQRNVKESFSVSELNNADKQLSKLQDVRIIYLPPMTVAASHAAGENCEGKASDALNRFVRESNLLKIKPDTRHFGFDCSGSSPPPGLSGMNEASNGYEMWASIPKDMEVPAPLVKRKFDGGLYAAYMIKMGDFHHWNTLRQWVNTNGKYNNDWGSARWEPFVDGMEHCLEEQLNYLNNIQNVNFNNGEMQLDLLFPIKPADMDNLMTMLDFQYIHLPASRFIGIDIITKGKKAVEDYADLWTKSSDFMLVLDSMSEHTTIFTDYCALMHHDNLEVSKGAMHYMVGRFMKADAPLPEGFDYWDIPESDVGISTLYGKFRDTKAYYMTRDKILSDGKDISYPIGYYHAEIYKRDNIPSQGAIQKFQY